MKKSIEEKKYLDGKYCGCCGNETENPHTWCNRCKPHIRNAYPFWEQTYYAQYKKECPNTNKEYETKEE